MLACAALNLVAPLAPHSFGGREAMFTFLMVISLCLVFGMFHGTEYRPGKDWHGFPYRWFVLPVPTWLLIACPMAWSVLAVEAMWMAWSRLVFAPTGVNVPAFLCPILAAGLLSYQGVLWGLAGFRVTRIVALSLTALTFANLSFLFMMPDLVPGISKSTAITTTFALALVAIAGAWWSVERQRRGGGRGRGRLKVLLLQLGDRLPRRRRRFLSATRAQFWYEWRRGGWLLPASVGATLLCVFVPISWRLRSEPQAVWWILAWAFALSPLLAAVIGKAFAIPDPWASDLSLPPFLAVRPIATGDLVMTKMKAAAASAAAAVALVMIFLAIWLSGWANINEVRQFAGDWIISHSRLPVVAAILLFVTIPILLSWRFLVSGLWLGLSGNRRWVIGGVGFQVAGLVALIYGIVFAVNHYRDHYLAACVTWLGWGLLGAVLLKLWLAVFSWKNITPLRKAQYALLWAIATLFVVLPAWLVCPEIFWLKHLVLVAALLPVPLARIGLAPRALANNRHQG